MRLLTVMLSQAASRFTWAGRLAAGSLLIRCASFCALALALAQAAGADRDLPAFMSSAAVAAQTGAGLPPNWGLNEEKPVPASYRLDLQGGVTPENLSELERSLRALPSISIVLPQADLFDVERGIYSHPRETGKGWERAAQIRFLPVDGSPGFEIKAGLRIHGGWSRRPEESPKHSFRLAFRKQYGARDLEYPLFGSKPDRFNTLVLRAGNNNTWLHPDSAERRRADYLRDSWMRATHAAMGYAAARDRFVHLYLNGLYWGVYDLTERPDAAFAAEREGGDVADYDSRNSGKIMSGDDLAWKKLFALVNAGVTNAAEYAEVSKLVDIPAFIDYMILNFYGANGDWDRVSNWYASRRRDPPGPWRFQVWDGERTLEGVDDDRIEGDEDESPMRLFQRLRGYAAFQQSFRNRAHLHLTGQGALAPQVAGERYRQLAQQLEPAIFAEAARWGYYRQAVHPFRLGPFERYNRDDYWKPEVHRLLEQYFPHRAEALSRQLRALGLLAMP